MESLSSRLNSSFLKFSDEGTHLTATPGCSKNIMPLTPAANMPDAVMHTSMDENRQSAVFRCLTYLQNKWGVVGMP